MPQYGEVAPIQYGNYPPQHPQSAYGYSNHDLMTPVDVAGALSSRKASMTSSMGMQKLFRRKANDAAFDEELGADIGEIAGGEMSFSDITHLRGTGGRYNIALSMQPDSSAPIIPVLGPGHTGPTRDLNNIQYRKQMNHQKKMNLANGLRAMSLAGGNPMMNSNVSQEYARSMSFNNRAMSMEQGNGPRTMSLQAPMNRPRPGVNGQMPPQMSSRGPFPGQQIYSPGNPNVAPNMGPNMGPNGPRAMSLRSQNIPPQMRGPGQVPGQIPGQGPRLNSLNGPAGPRTQSFTGGNPMSRGVTNGYYPQNGFNRSQQPYYPNQQHPQYANQYGNQFNQYGGQYNQYPQAPNGNGQAMARKDQNPDASISSDSLMHVVEEEAEYEKTRLDPGKAGTLNFANSRADSDDNQDYVYRLEDGNAAPLSRKSTIKKSDSMRVRRLDLFNKGTEEQQTTDDAYAGKEDPSFNLSVVGDRLSKKLAFQLDDEESRQHRAEQMDKLKALNATATDDGEIYYTSPEFFSPSKHPQVAEDGAAPTQHVSPDKPAKKPLKLNRLAENTAYSGFRSISQQSSEDVHDNEPRFDRSETESQGSVYSKGTPKHSDSLNPLVSLSSYHPSPPRDADEHKSEFDFSSANDQIETSMVQEENTTENESPQPAQNEKYQDDAKNNISTDKLSQLEFEPAQPKDGQSQVSADAVNAELHRRTSTLSRSGSELKLKGLLPAGGLITVQQPITHSDADKVDQDKMDIPKTRGALISSKSKNFIKRLSRSTSKRNVADDLDSEQHSVSLKLRVSSSVSLHDNGVKKPLVFTKEELAIMTCNNDLQNELQFVTSELALSIKRELVLEHQLKSGTKDHTFDDVDLQKEMVEKAKIIVDLQDKLNNERRLRFISEEHALLSEHGQTPSALKLDYEKNELYKQLLAKNDTVNQLQDKIDEIESAGKRNYDDDLLQKYNELTMENSKLRENLESARLARASQVLEESATVESHEYEQAQILSLRTQRDELREMITKLTSSQSVELKTAYERIRTLEEKLRKVNMINDKLSKKGERPDNSASLGYGTGGRLHGFDVVSPTKSVLGSN